MHNKTDHRTCPACGNAGVKKSEVYPHGTECESCKVHIEVNIVAITLLIAGLLGIMFVDLRFFDTGIGLVAALGLIYVGCFSDTVYTEYMPLKKYTDK